MILVYQARPWLRVGVGYVAGRLAPSFDGKSRVVFQDWLACDNGLAECLACQTGERSFRRRHTLARFIRAHRHCGELVR